MKKLLLITVFLAWATVAYAVVTVTFNISDDYAINKMLPAFNAQDGANVRIEIEAHDSDPSNEYEYRVDMSFHLPAKLPGDNNIAYGKKRIAMIIAAFVKAHEKKLKEDIARAYYENVPSTAITPPNPNEIEQ